MSSPRRHNPHARYDASDVFCFVAIKRTVTRLSRQRERMVYGMPDSWQDLELICRPGQERGKSLRSCSVSGVRKPGVVLTAAGSTAKDLIELCGGMGRGARLQGLSRAAPRAAFCRPTWQTFPSISASSGSTAATRLSSCPGRCEGCGLEPDALLRRRELWCTPCRNGTEKAVQLISAGDWNPQLLEDQSQVADPSICGLGQAAPNPLKSVFKYFPEDLR